MIAVALYADQATHDRLEDALAQRLMSIASLVSQSTNPHVAFLEAGDEQTRTHERAIESLIASARRARVERIVVVHKDGHRTLLDSAGQLPVGREYGRARFDQVELERVAAGKLSASVLFTGPHDRPYKTGYAPFYGPSDQYVGFVAVEAAADYADALAGHRRNLALGTAIALLGLIAAAVYTARTVALPLADLSRAAERIGGGTLDTQIPRGGPTEALVLADTMRRMASSLQARDEELQMMLAGIAHEVRNPLGGIELFGGLLKEDLPSDDPRAAYVDKILKELATLSMVVNDFLHFARRTEIEPRPVSAHDLLSEVSSVAEQAARERGVALELDVPTDFVVDVDPESMKRALLNLLMNGIQAAPPTSGTVLLSASRIAGQVTFTVVDNGPGVPSDRREQIFQPFFTTKQKGTGLGLALAQKTVTQHDGEIRVEDAEGGGARFVLTVKQ